MTEVNGQAGQLRPYRYVGACLWAGVLLCALFLLFWAVVGQNLPPYSASLSADDLATLIRGHTTLLRVGMVLTMCSGVFYLVWGVGVAEIMRALGGDNHLLAELEVWGAGFTTIVLVFPPGVWLAAAFRPETDPKILQMLYDLGWMLFDCCFSLSSLQFIAAGVCIISQDKRQVPLLPKWLGWLGVWAGFAFLLLLAIPFFKSGPFSRNGIVNYWIEFSIFFVFILVLTGYCLAALKRLRAEAFDGNRPQSLPT